MIADQLSTFRLDRRSGVGVAAQIRARLAFLIADGSLTEGERLPTVRTLAHQLGVNVNTIRAAYARLEADGLVRTRHGVGTVVLPATATTQPPGTGPLGTNTIGVIIGGLNPFYLPLLRGIEDVAAEQGTLVLVSESHDSPALAETMIRRLIARGVDGIVAVSVGGIDGGELPGTSHSRQVPPIVYVDQPHRTGHVLLFDGRRAGYLATHHLRDHGHERIGIVTPPRSWPNVQQVYTGYVDALEQRGGDLSPELVSEVGEFSLDAGRLGLGQLFSLRKPPTAVFAVDEVLALGVLHEARSRGLGVPVDVALAGYTDSPVSALVDPPLTMVSVPSREIGFRAMRTLYSLISGHKPRPRRAVLDVELVVRGSCGQHETSGAR